MASQGSQEVPRGIEIFSEPDYYPSPSDKVISCSNQGSKKHIIKTNIIALIVKLTSPLDVIDYSFLSDFFLSYRKFLAPRELLSLFIDRFRWSTQEILSDDSSRRKIGQITVVRTFVLIRHWVLNYFAQDFLADNALRSQYVDFVNSISMQHSEDSSKIVLNIIVNIKKTWVYCVRLMWEDVKFEQPLETFDDWIQLKVRDVTTRSLKNKEGKRLSLYALQSSSNPNFRNKSVLSLYLSEENFQLPQNNLRADCKQSSKLAKRTASMFLFPQDNLNTIALKSSQEDSRKQNMEPKHIQGVTFATNGSNVSNLMKDLSYSVSPSVDKVIPPTPAKKVEFILRSSYLPPDITSDKSQTHFKEAPTNSKNTSQQVNQHRGIIGLLTKWKKNHHMHSASKAGRAIVNPEIDNLIKFVFSITSLDNKTNSHPDLDNVITSKFDILSARTIDEVEYLVAMENDLLSKLQVQENSVDFDAGEEEEKKNAHETFNAMDNLNLYKTVSSIATSVISLSQTLRQNQLTSPSNAANERRLVKSSTAILRNDGFSTMKTVLDISEVTTPKSKNPCTNKLVFHSSASLNRNCRKSLPDSNLVLTPTKVSNSTSSVIKPYVLGVANKGSTIQVDRLSINSSQLNDDDTSIISAQRENYTLGKGYGEQNGTPSLKRKGARQNLREFNFEENCPSGSNEEIDDPENTDIDNSSFFTSYEEISVKSSPKQYTPASSFLGQSSAVPSGRISLRRSTMASIKNQTEESLPHLIAEETEFARRDEELVTNEEEIRQLEEHTSVLISSIGKKLQRKDSRSSDNPSISTNLLFGSRQVSPKKDMRCLSSAPELSSVGKETSKKILIGLSSTPSIHSVVSDDSFSSFHSNDTFEKQSPTCKENALSEQQKISNNQVEIVCNSDSLLGGECDEGMTNKYLFSPDSESVDYASPEKNVDDLKNQFFSLDDSRSDMEAEKGHDAFTECDARTVHEHHRRTVSPIVSPDKINESKLDIFANMTDDSLQEDPVNVALMKLEGTYKFKEEGSQKAEKATLGTPTSSELAKEVERLGLKDINMSADLSTERQSLIMERRRLVKSEIPYTPGHSTRTRDQFSNISDDQISQLLKNYRLQDQRLHTKNADQHVPFILMYDSLSIAKQMTLIEREIIKEIDWKDLLDLKMKDKIPAVTSWLQLLVQNKHLSGIDLAISRFNLTVDWIVSEIVLIGDTKLRRNTIQRFIHIAEHCENFQNYNTLMQIVLALNSIVVQSFRDAWRLIEPGDLLTWGQLKNIPSLEKNYYNVRKMLNEIDPIKGCIPFLVVYLSDLSLNSEKRDWIVSQDILNYSKFQTNVEIVKNFIQRAEWSKFYEIDVNEELLSKCVYISSLAPEELRHLTTS